MSLGDLGDADLSDDWIERDRPPTLKLSHQASLSGSVNILSDKPQNWNNVPSIATNDLLTKKTKPLTSLFERSLDSAQVTQENDHFEGLSVVEEEEHEASDPVDRDGQSYRDAWAKLEIGDRKIEKDNQSDAETVRPGTARSADGIIPNFSFPRGGTQTTQKGTHGDLEESGTQQEAVVPPIQQKEGRNESETSVAPSTPKKDADRSDMTGSLPRSPLKLFHSEQDTFTRDHTARMIGMLSAAEPIPPQTAQDTQPGTQKSHQSNISTMSEMTDSGPERKKVKTHEPKGSVTLQNFNENADRMAAKLRAKSGGLGKGLPRPLDETKVVLGRRISSVSERLDQQRKRERAIKPTSRPNSGFEDMEIAAEQFVPDAKFGTTSSISRFSDWESEANTESRQVSAATQKPVSMDDEIAAQSIKSSVLYGSVKQTWTEIPGRITANDRPSSAPIQDNVRRTHTRSPSSTSDLQRKLSPRIKNFPPSAMETMRHGDMIFNPKTGYWRHVDEESSGVDPFEDADNAQSRQSSPKKSSRFESKSDEYPSEIDLSLSSGSTPHQSFQTPSRGLGAAENDSNPSTDRSPCSDITGSAASIPTSPLDMPSVVVHQHDSQVERPVQEESYALYEQELSHLAAEMTMSESTGKLLQAVNKRYGAGPWEAVQDLDLTGLGLETLINLAKFFPNLRRLDISDNQISSLGGLPDTLMTLIARDNRLTSHRISFTHLRELQRLDLSGNQLEDMDCFRPLIHLRHLSLIGNSLKCIDGLHYLHNLITFDASANMLSEINLFNPESGTQLDQLEKLNLAENMISSIAGVEHLESLMHLDLSKNRLQEFEPTQDMLRLKVLKMCNNALDSIDLTFCPRIRVLYLDDNHLQHIYAPRPLKHIESFSLRRQHSSHIDIDLNNFCETKKLYLSGNKMPMVAFETTFFSLKYLEVAGIGMSDFPENFSSTVPNLRVLNASNNNLGNIDALQGLTRLERLILVNNKLSRVETLTQALTPLTRLKTLDIRGNPLTMKFYAPVQARHEVDYFANFDGLRASEEALAHWLQEDAKYYATLRIALRKVREAYQNVIWSGCRALRWHDGRPIDPEQLLLADDYVATFSETALEE